MHRSMIVAVVVMASLTIIVIAGLEVLHPGDNSVVIGHILTIAVPTTTALLALLNSKANTAKIQDIHLSINSRLDQLMVAEKALSHTQGVTEGRDQKR